MRKAGRDFIVSAVVQKSNAALVRKFSVIFFEGAVA